MCKRTRLFSLAIGLYALVCASAAFAQEPGHQHLVFFRDTPQELEVFKVQGRIAGPTAMLLGGIHGDEPGAYLSADLYADLVPLRGNLIIVPRANFQAVLHNLRGPSGDMNRKFNSSSADDPELQVIAVLKALMAECDLLLTLHDGSGFYKPEVISDLANPKRYGQCVIADTARFIHPKSGKTIELEATAKAAIDRVNATIEESLHKFHFFNMETASETSLHKEHRDSATYYALMELGIPAFCIEASKNLPGLDIKIYQHSQLINAFLELYGITLEPPGLRVPTPAFGHLVIRVGDGLPLAVSNGQTLHVQHGERIEVLHTAANIERGLMVTDQEKKFQSIMHKPLLVERPFRITVYKDSQTLGHVAVAPYPNDQKGGPGVSGKSATPYAAFARPGTSATLDMLPGTMVIASLKAEKTLDTPVAPPQKTSTGQVNAFLVEVDGKPASIKPGEKLPVMLGSKLKIVDIQAENPLPRGTVMNLKGFVAKEDTADNAGEDRGSTVAVATDMMQRHSIDGKGEEYAINAELGETILSSCSIRLVQPVLESVTVRFGGQTKVLRLGSRTPIVPGTPVEVVGITLKGGHIPGNPRYTLAGRSFSVALPQTLTMREIAINLAVFNGDVLAGKITWVPGK